MRRAAKKHRAERTVIKVETAIAIQAAIRANHGEAHHPSFNKSHAVGSAHGFTIAHRTSPSHQSVRYVHRVSHAPSGVRSAVLSRALRVADFRATMQFGRGFSSERKIMSASFNECLLDIFGRSEVVASNEHKHTAIVNSVRQPLGIVNGNA